MVGNVAENLTRTCVSTCANTTYEESNACVSKCSNGSYADPLINKCSGSCTGGYYGDPSTNKCVQQCPVGYYKDSTMYCLKKCVGKFADNITWSCTGKCSTGYWGFNLSCETICPNNTFGYLPDRICYQIVNRPVSSPVYFADNLTQTWVTECPLNPLTFGDTSLRYCI